MMWTSGRTRQKETILFGSIYVKFRKGEANLWWKSGCPWEGRSTGGRHMGMLTLWQIVVLVLMILFLFCRYVRLQ